MSHDSCVTLRGQLTDDEEARFTDWFLRSLRDRPDDFELDHFTIRDRKTAVTVWVANGTDYVHVWRPAETAYFRRKYQRHIWQAIHDHRHRGGSPASRAIDEAIRAAPLSPESPPLSLPADEARTEPEVAKLRTLVAAIVERQPALVGTSVGALILAIGGFIAHAFAG